MQRLVICVFTVATILASEGPRYAVAIMKENNSSASGLISFKQDSPNQMTEIVAAIKGLNRNQKHAIHVHTFGDLTDGCTSAGAHYNPFNKTHGSLTSEMRHIGDLSNIQANENGQVHMKLQTNRLTLFGEYSIIGRSMIIHAKPDDEGRGGDEESKKTGNAGGRITCGVIGLSSAFRG